MPVDNDLIDAKIADLKAEYATCTQKMNDISVIVEELMSIREEGKKTEEGAIIYIPVTDKGTGAQMTPNRRQEIYDAQISKANTILS